MFMDMPPVIDINPVAIEVSTVSAVSNVAISPINTQYLLMDAANKLDAIGLSARFFVRLNGENWIPPMPMGGGGSSKPNNDANFALLNGEAGWASPVPLGGGGSSKPNNDANV
uniref:hypothetical protein n=1 Tax=uncultured Shewanella sp. TaxID=173975 RepID=UPI0026123BDF